MRFEDFLFDLQALRDLASLHGRERRRETRCLLSNVPVNSLPETRKWKRRATLMLIMGLVYMICLIIAAAVDSSSGEITTASEICFLAALGAYAISMIAAACCIGMVRRTRVKRLFALSEQLNTRAQGLGETEFLAACDTLTYLPEWLVEADWPEDARCGCWNCMKMLDKQDYCPECRNNRVVYGDSECPLDENRLRAIHELMR